MPPELLRGGTAIDDRGHLGYVNGVDFTPVRRLYVVSNHRPGFVRAWHGHQREDKWVMVVSGAAIVAAVEVDDWEHPSRDAMVHRFVLSEHQPDILHIPAGYANGFKTLTPGTRVMFWSTATLEGSLSDDFRWPATYWDPWEVTER